MSGLSPFKGVHLFVVGYDDFMSFGTSRECVCKECSTPFHHVKKLSEHIKKNHELSSIDYYIKHECGGMRPTCPVCGGETRFISLGDGFKKYCIVHRSIAESEAGKVGGKLKKTWSKGLTKKTDERLAALALNQTGEGNPFYGHHHTIETKQKNADAHRLSFDAVLARLTELVPTIEVMSSSSEYATQDDLLRVKCMTCSTTDAASFSNLQRCWRCKTCFPLASKPQLEVAEFVRSLGFEDVEISTRKVIPPLELDVWVPSQKLAIEYHGLYWHSGGKEGEADKRSHRQKYERCEAEGIRLFQFFSDEWINKGDICRSMLVNALHKNATKLNARDCEVRAILPAQSKEFANANHISGGTRAAHHLGLFHKSRGLVGIATTRTPIQKKHGHACELARMCFLRNTSVRGGASKLLSHVKQLARDGGFEALLSYAELRYGTGNVYEKDGFTLVGEALNNYWYTDGERRYDRFKFRAQPGKPEKQVAEEAGVRSVWGCGNRIYLLKL